MKTFLEAVAIGTICVLIALGVIIGIGSLFELMMKGG